MQEQRAAIERYAGSRGFGIVQWFSENETAAKTGRPVFIQMLKQLRSGKAEGIVIHKIDRSARNLKDWAEIGQLAEAGIEVHFASEAVDLSSPSGMLSADVQAVVAAHYIRNLREEVKKGYYGRLNQGLCPYPAPLGYRNNGEGKPKTIDPIQGPIVRQAFELYATGRYNLLQLVNLLYKMGLRTRATPKKPGGLKVSGNSVAGMLSNPFYFGMLHIKRSDRTFAGIHEPLISKRLFEQVQQVRSGRYVRKTRVHRFMFSRMIECAACGRALVAETHKGHVYYRCHRQHELPTSLTEREIDRKLSKVFERLQLTAEESALFDAMLAGATERLERMAAQRLKAADLDLAAANDRATRLTDAYLDGLVDKKEFEEKKTALTLERQEVERRASAIRSGRFPERARCERIVELIKTAHSLYKDGLYDEKRGIIKSVMSNRTAQGKTLDFTLRFPFIELAKHYQSRFGGAPRGRGRKFWRKLIEHIGAITQGATACDDQYCL